MESGMVFELIGYLASGVVALSLMMRSVTRLRLIVGSRHALTLR